MILEQSGFSYCKEMANRNIQKIAGKKGKIALGS